MLEVINKITSQGAIVDSKDIPDLNLSKPRKYARAGASVTKVAADGEVATAEEEVLDQTEFETRMFKEYMKAKVQWYKDRGQKPDYYIIVRNSLLRLYVWDIVFCSVLAVLAECSAVYYNY